ncbi:SGNH/GDSL hydrolase family protein [Mucilaginibacter ginsenosidivorax]|uniref:SGNH/GDSL hydrolase family protein n=1 Tax=Mucilaginibacter ginsenosidivorax TaxID=862126 RepID=A0A5B8W6J3_9SPHI|nr:SGNH/GDSL hydrolase family protein [Mucilaginibacter ginsenosidivorax]QEC77868.1 SGNH/GDSL hydrolase family protein [Mucilaginibacter ginsenosidivorax]
MKALFIILCSIGALTACSKKNDPMQNMNSGPNPPSTGTVPVTGTTTDTLSYLALGDSYTIGQSVTARESFPYQLAAELPGFKVTEPTIIARTGWITDQLINAIKSSTINDKTYDFVTLLIGVNDQYDGYSKDNYRIKFAAVLNTAIRFAKGNKKHVFVLSIPDYGVTPFGNGNEAVIGPDIDKFNAINLDESKKAGVIYVDITAISKQAAFDLSLLANDRLHPSAKMYNQWVLKLIPEVLAQFKK